MIYGHKYTINLKGKIKMVKITDLIELDKVFGDIRKYFAYSLSQSAFKGGNIVECGVFKGSTINHLADLVNPQIVYGFDSFEGLPEAWERGGDKETIPAGFFATKEMPKVKKNVQLIKGWFKDTLPKWAAENTQPLSLLHLDCDIYSSTLDALVLLNSIIKPGTVIILDDVYSWQDEEDYAYWRRGQWKALREWMRDYSRDVEAVSRLNRRSSAAILVTD